LQRQVQSDHSELQLNMTHTEYQLVYENIKSWTSTSLLRQKQRDGQVMANNTDIMSTCETSLLL